MGFINIRSDHEIEEPIVGFINIRSDHEIEEANRGFYKH